MVDVCCFGWTHGIVGSNLWLSGPLGYAHSLFLQGMHNHFGEVCIRGFTETKTQGLLNNILALGLCENTTLVITRLSN